MGENNNNFFDQSESNFEGVGSNDERIVEFDISDVEQILPESDGIKEASEPIKKRNGWVGLLAFTLSITAICSVSIFLLTSIFQGSFLLKGKQQPSAEQETLVSEDQQNQDVIKPNIEVGINKMIHTPAKIELDSLTQEAPKPSPNPFPTSQEGEASPFPSNPINSHPAIDTLKTQAKQEPER